MTMYKKTLIRSSSQNASLWPLTKIGGVQYGFKFKKKYCLYFCLEWYENIPKFCLGFLIKSLLLNTAPKSIVSIIRKASAQSASCSQEPVPMSEKLQQKREHC